MVIGLKVCFTGTADIADTEGTADIADIADTAAATENISIDSPPPSAGPLGRHKKVRPHIGADF